MRGWLARLIFATDHVDEAIGLLERSMAELRDEHPPHYRIVLATLAAAKARAGALDAARSLASLWIDEMWPRASPFPSDHIAFVLARLGHARAASRLLGLGDAHLAHHKRVRMVPEAWSAARAAELATENLGADALASSRGEGPVLGRESCLALARAALAS